MFRPLRVLILSALLGAILGGCRTDATLNVRSDVKGGGVISVDLVLDRDATLAIKSYDGSGDPGLLTKDLVSSGWAVGRFESTDGGGSSLHGEKAFATFAQGNSILQELTGPKGSLSSLRLVRKSSLTGSTVSLKGNVDLREGLGTFGDATLKAITGSTSNLGLEDTEVARQAGVDLTKAFRFALSADLIDVSKRWDVNIGAQQAIVLTAKRFAYEALVGALAVLGSLAGLVVLFVSSRKRRSTL